MNPYQALIYRQCYEKWGVSAQMMMVIEEMAELTKEICKADRKGLEKVQTELTEELVDTEIMLEQLKLILSDHFYLFDENYDKMRREKLNRLKSMVEGHI